VKNPIRTRIISLALPLIAIADISYHKSKGNIRSLVARFTDDEISKQKTLNVATSHFNAAQKARDRLKCSLSLLRNRLFSNPASGYEPTISSSADLSVQLEDTPPDFRLENAELRSLKNDLRQIKKDRSKGKQKLLKLEPINKKIINLKIQLARKNQEYNGWLNLFPLSTSQWLMQKQEISKLEILIPTVIKRLRDRYSIEEADLPAEIASLKESQLAFETREHELEETIRQHPRTPNNTPVNSPVITNSSSPGTVTTTLDATALTLDLQNAVSAKFPKESMLEDVSRIAGEKTKSFFGAIFQHKDVIKSWSYDDNTGNFQIELSEVLQVKIQDPLAIEAADRPNSILVLGKSSGNKILVNGKLNKKDGKFSFDPEQLAGYGRAMGKYQSAFLDKLYYSGNHDSIVFKKAWLPEKHIPFGVLIDSLNAGSVVEGAPLEILTSGS
jgi:hypothetical protein